MEKGDGGQKGEIVHLFSKLAFYLSRLKAKRVTKRKTRTEEIVSAPGYKDSDISPERPLKRARTDAPTTAPKPRPTPTSSSRPTQIISSLFSYNPKIETPIRPVAPKNTALPSNAPLDSSTFSGLGLNPLLISHLTNKMNILKPTSIQRAALPAILSSPSTAADVRDVFIQSQTGSGKTMAFLLPIIQDLLPLSSLSYIDRSIGTLAIIIAPTRELAKQISDVLEALLKLRLRPEDENAEDNDASSRLTRWLVSGLLIGGATRTHEKARLRKGVPILVSTPGRLLDHLQNTSSFNVGRCRWLVLDEADRLMELGFEDTIKGIIQGLDGRRKLAKQAIEEGRSMEVGGWDWQCRRRTILCSATIREDVQKLAGTTLINPVMIKATEGEADKVPLTSTLSLTSNDAIAPSAQDNFTPPSQLAQKYVVVPLKLRLVALIALLRSLIGQSQGDRGNKIIVFLSCTDSVDFHWKLLGGSSMGEEESALGSDGEDVDNKPTAESTSVKCPLLPDSAIYRLHGSLPTSVRLASLKGFSGSAKQQATRSSASILLCTSVASRGLDLPLVRAVVQYDLPTEGGATEYVHRVGRTARAGKGGEAWSLIAPSEAAWVGWVETKMQGDSSDTGQNVTLTGVQVDAVLRTGFGGKGVNYEERATEVQLSFERWVLQNKTVRILLAHPNPSHLIIFQERHASPESLPLTHESIRYTSVQ